MQFTLNWLKRHLDLSLSNNILNDINLISKTLIDLGIEVEFIKLINPLITVKVKSFQKISEKLNLCNIEIPNEVAQLIDYPTSFQVMCGANNVRENMVTVLCPIGTTLPNGILITKKQLLGHESYGMLCSAQEIGEGNSETDGILDLQLQDNLIYKYKDVIFDVKVSANRVDLYSVRGIARELASADLGKLKDLKIETPQNQLELEVQNSTEVRFSFGQIDNLSLDKEIPELLSNIGRRSELKFQQLQDFVTIDLGFPLAIYDTNIVNKKIFIDKVNTKNIYKTVLGEYETEGNEILIKSTQNNLCIGGAVNIDGFNEKTQNVILESACFTRNNFNTRSGYISESEKLFYLGVDQELPVIPYVYTLCSGEKYKVIYLSGENYDNNNQIFLPWNLWYRVTEYEFSLDDMKKSLEKFGFKVELRKEKQDNSIHDEFGILVTIPSWRKDIEIAEDLIGEIVRINNLSQGFEKVSHTPEVINLSFQSLEEKIRSKIVDNGYYEVVNIPFSGKGDFELKNSIDDNKKYLRCDLIEGLLNSMNYQINNNSWGGKLFEIGKIYPSESVVCSILLYGKKQRNWMNNKNLDYNFFDCKNDFFKLFNLKEENLKENTMVNNSSLEYELRFDIGYLGKIKPELIKNNKINNVFYGEILLNKINLEDKIQLINTQKEYIDFSVEFKDKISWKELKSNIDEDLILFDTYDDGKKYSFTLEITDKNKKQEIKEKIINIINSLDGKLR